MTRVVYACSFVPAEWIEAHGLRAARVLPAVRPDSTWGPQTGMCPFARAFAEYAAGADTDTAVVFTTTCDQMRRAADLVAQHRRGPVFVLNVPATKGPAAQRIYAAELYRLSEFLQTTGGHPPHLPLRQPGPLAQPSQADRVRLAVLGSPIPAYSRFEAYVHRVGGTIVLDASDSGERMRPASLDERHLQADPVAELARAYLAMPSIHQRPDDAFVGWLRRELPARQVQGVILRRYVWCDLWHAMTTCIRDIVNVPVLDIEVDAESLDDDSGLGTRIGGLVEMIQSSARQAKESTPTKQVVVNRGS